jgi:hypothetical protein
MVCFSCHAVRVFLLSEYVAEYAFRRNCKKRVGMQALSLGCEVADRRLSRMAVGSLADFLNT